MKREHERKKSSDEEKFNAPKADKNVVEKNLVGPEILTNSSRPEPEGVDVHRLEALRRYVWHVDSVDLLEKARQYF